MKETRIARQKIIDTNNNLVAYELLYRNQNLYKEELNDIEKTADVLMTTLFKVGKEKISGSSTISINFSDTFLLEVITSLLDPQEVIIEILETVTIDSNFVEKVAELKRKNYKVALDDFNYASIQDNRIFDYVDILKVDFMSSTKEDLLFAENLSKKYSNLVLLAEKIETKEEYEYAVNSGYSLFQGYFISKPEELTFNVN